MLNHNNVRQQHSNTQYVPKHYTELHITRETTQGELLEYLGSHSLTRDVLTRAAKVLRTEPLFVVII